jgi:hypothetical protein
MAITRAPRLVSKPAEALRAPAVTSPTALKRKTAKQLAANVAARAKTKAETNRIVGIEPIAVDPADTAARTSIAKRQKKLKATAAAGDAVAEAMPRKAPSDPKPSPRIKRTAVDRLDDPPPATGMALIERVTQAVERELSQIEIIVSGHHVKPQQRTEAERRARTLASLARTLSEVRKLRAEEKPKRDDDDAVPRDLNEFRLELARRLDRLVAEAKIACPGETEPT